MKRIGLVGGLSWESTAAYYALLNQMTARERGAWRQPALLVDSLDFGEVVTLQAAGDWSSLGAMLAESARRLASGGATVLAICANTMHKNFDDVVNAVDIPVVDVRDALIHEISALGASSVSLLGTKYVMQDDFYVSHLERSGVSVVVPIGEQIDTLQSMIYDELTQGVVTDASRRAFVDIANDCRARGGDVVGLCCTEFGLLVNEGSAPWPFVDSTVAHVKALLRH